ncbi:MAG: sulfite exporter TauE/SafE family protein [Actinomycetota bacterium]
MDPLVALIGLAGGLTIGLAGTGAGSIVTPLLILRGIPSVAAVGTSLLAAAGAKFIGAGVHHRQGTVNHRLVRQLASGSIPAAVLGIYVIKRLGGLDGAGPFVSRALGVVLILIAASLLLDAVLIRKRSGWLPSLRMPTDRPLVNAGIGAVVGFTLAVTSAGSGSLVIAALLIAYPGTIPAELVGTSVFHGAILQAVAGAGHIALGTVRAATVLSLMVGYLPGIVLGSRLAHRAHPRVLRPVIVIAVIVTGVKLI